MMMENVTGVGAGEAKIIVTIPAEYTINGTNDIVLETKVTVKVPITGISLPQTKNYGSKSNNYFRSRNCYQKMHL